MPNPERSAKRAHPLHDVYRGMIRRCHNPRAIGYRNYGGRGITVCARWRRSFWDFVADVGERPSPAHTLDRWRNHLGYEPANVRWATRREQNRNTSYNRLMTAHGRTQTAQDWIEESGLPDSTFWNRHHRGWSLERILSMPAQTKAPNHTLVPPGGYRYCQEHGLRYQTVKSRLYRGMSWEEATTIPVAPQKGGRRST